MPAASAWSRGPLPNISIPTPKRRLRNQVAPAELRNVLAEMVIVEGNPNASRQRADMTASGAKFLTNNV
jgi:hypothetical protein